MKYLLLFLASSILTSCSVSNIINNRLEKLNIYNDEIDYEIHLTKDSIFVKLVPLRHLGTEKFYENLKTLIKDFQNKDYVVYYELVYNDSILNDEYLRKLRKITALKKDIRDSNILNYEELILEKIKKIDPDFQFKKKLKSQPKYDTLIYDKSKSKNVDVSFFQFVNEYERLYGEIKLDSCDYVDNWINTECSTKRAKGLDKVVIDFRNNHVVNEILKSKNPKIIVLYGEYHMKGISKGLIKNGFKITN